jgi:hypothetical protein
MTVTVTTSRVTYTADGLLDTFEYAFRIFNDTDLTVYVAGVEQELDVDYIVSNTGTEDGGDVVFTTPPADEALVVIERSIPFTQLLDLVDYDRFPAESLEAALDRLVLMAQQLATTGGRTVTQNAASDLAELELPIPEAGKLVRWNATEDGLENAEVVDLAGAVAAASDGEVTAGTEATTRLFTPAQLVLAVDTHQHQIVVDSVLPGTPDPDTFYFITE